VSGGASPVCVLRHHLADTPPSSASPLPSPRSPAAAQAPAGSPSCCFHGQQGSAGLRSGRARIDMWHFKVAAGRADSAPAGCSFEAGQEYTAEGTRKGVHAKVTPADARAGAAASCGAGPEEDPAAAKATGAMQLYGRRAKV